MTNSPSANPAELWQFEPTSAKLRTARLSGAVTLDKPDAGLGGLAWNNSPLDGSVLGFSIGQSVSPQDAFVRGADLVAVYAAPEPRSFSWQVYWRASEPGGDLVLVDAILSFQTDRLESFPSVTTQSQLAANEMILVGVDGKSTKVDFQPFDEAPTSDHDCLVLRSSTGRWSYLEMTHPLDQGTWQLTRSEDGRTKVRRVLGGSFLEKGVIRRLRLRGAFLARENDLQQAAQLFTRFAAETPPLTV